MKDLIAKLEEMISLGDIENAEAYENQELEYWDSGNSSDIFELGVEVGYTQAIQTVLSMLYKEGETK